MVDKITKQGIDEASEQALETLVAVGRDLNPFKDQVEGVGY